MGPRRDNKQAKPITRSYPRTQSYTFRAGAAGFKSRWASATAAVLMCCFAIEKTTIEITNSDGGQVGC